MKAKDNKPVDLSKMSEKELLTLVAAKLKDRCLFPEMIKEAKRYLLDVKIIHK